MDRIELGGRLCNWHTSMTDPIYAVGSFYVSNQRYPDQDIVEDCLENLERDINKFNKMLAGEKVSVYNNHYGKQILDLRAFAGYSDKELNDYIFDIREIVIYLKIYLKQDYS